MRARLVVATAVLSTACGPDMAAWQARLATPAVRQFKGDWSLTLQLDDNALSPRRRETSGEVAITLNDAALDAHGFPGRPLFFGSYDMRFDSLGFAAGATSDVPAAAGGVIGDSLVLILAPSSDAPVELRGRASGDSVTGRWHVHRRAGTGATGEFLMRRRPRDP